MNRVQCAADTSDHKDTNKKQKQTFNPVSSVYHCGYATLYIRLTRFAATVRARIGLHSRSKDLCTTFHMLVDDSSKRELSQAPGLLYFARSADVEPEPAMSLKTKTPSMTLTSMFAWDM